MNTITVPEKLELGETRLNPKPPTYARYQIKVADAVVLLIPTTLVALLMIGTGLLSRRELYVSIPTILLIALIVVSPLLSSWLVALKYVPHARADGIARRRHLYKFLGWALPFSVLLGALTIPNLLRTRTTQREFETVETLSRLAQAQHSFFKGSAYASSIRQLYESDPKGLINREIVNAEYGFGRPGMQPLNGYYFKVLTRQSGLTKSGVREYIDSTGRMTGGFAFFAFPATSGCCGVTIPSYMINQDGEMYQRDFGSYTNEMIDEMVFDPKDWRRAE